MSGRIVTPYERSLTTTVNDIEHITANSYNGVGIVKIFFQPNADIRTANAQVPAVSQTVLKQMPPGATPPLILNYSASTVPIIQLALSGEGLTEQILGDIAINQLRPPLVTGARRPRIPTAASSVKSRSTSTRRSSSRWDCPDRMLPTRWLRRT